MNRAILTGSEAISAHYYTTMSRDHRGITWERRLARSTRSYIGTAVERAVEDNITCLIIFHRFILYFISDIFLSLKCSVNIYIHSL